MRITVLLFSCLCFAKLPRILCQNETEIRTFELLEEGKKTIELTNQTYVVLFLGPTGSGKSTTIQWITGDNTKLISVETRNGSGIYIIEDTNGRIGSSSVSKTLYPELVIDVEKGTAFYDLPGFSDTRSPSYDIAASFFMKSVMDHVKNVKMIFLTSYYSVQKGVDRTIFPGLLKNIDDLVKDLDKYSNSMALVVTKVDNTPVRVRGKWVLKSDNVVIQEIADYLLELTEDYQKDMQRPDINDKRRSFCANAIKIVKIFLTKENGQFSRIKLFRRPDEAGPLSENELLVEEKLQMQKMISDNLLSTKTGPGDFGFTISDNSKLGINSLATMIDEKISSIVSKVGENIKEHFVHFVVEPVRTMISDNNVEALSLSEALEFPLEVDRYSKTLFEAVQYITRLKKITGLGEKIGEYLLELRVETYLSSNMIEEIIKKFSEYFEFFQLFCEDSLPISALAWAQSFQSPLSYLTASKQFVMDKATSLAEEIDSQITSDVDSIVGKIKSSFVEDVNRMAHTLNSLTKHANAINVNRSDAHFFHEKLKLGNEFLSKLVNDVKVLPAPQNLTDAISKCLTSMSFELTSESFLFELSRVHSKSEHFVILEKVCNTSFGFSSAHWSNSFKTALTYIQTQNVFSLADQKEKEISSSVNSTLKSLTDKARNIVDKESLKQEIDVAGGELRRWHSLFSSISDKWGTGTTFKEMIVDIAVTFSKLNVNELSIRDDFRSLDKNDKHLGFIKSIKGVDSDALMTPEWIAHINSLVSFLDVEVIFNGFVRGLYETLSKFEVQRDVRRYDVRDLNNWGVPGHAQGILVDKTNFKLFAEKTKAFNITDKKISAIIPNESQLLILNNVLTLALKNRVVAECPLSTGSTVTVKANFVKFSDLLDSNGKFKGCGWNNVDSLEIYALNAVFIDQDLNALGGRLKLSIVTPKLEVIGNRRIVLDGKDGKPLPKAANGAFPEGHGKDGLPGLAGGSAGAFFIATSTFIRSCKLLIVARGGKGGRGQFGGDGAKGQDGKTPHDMNSCDVKDYAHDGFDTSEIEDCKGNAFDTKCHWFYAYGRNGTRGGNAGSCGVGGKGGSSGESKIIGVKKSFERKIANDGITGIDGEPGAVGYGGDNGKDRYVQCAQDGSESKKNRGIGGAVGGLALLPLGPLGVIGGILTGIFAGSRFAKEHPKNTTLIERGHASFGKPSHSCNSKFPENPMPAALLENPGFYLRNFQKFLIESSNQRFIQPSLRAFEQINTSPGAKASRDTLGLIEDMKMVQSFSRKTDYNLVPFYDSLLANIQNYAANSKSHERTNEFKKVLIYLYTATLTQISNQKENHDSDLIIDLAGYLDVVSRSIKDLTTLNDEKGLAKVVETLKNDFEEENNKKIEEARNLIKTLITPELAKINSQFKTEISALVKETIVHQNAVIVDKAELIKKKRELEAAMIVNTFVKALNVVADVCLFVDPTGTTTIAIKSTTSVSETLLHGKPLQLPSKSGTDSTEMMRLGKSAMDLSASIKKDLNGIAEVTRGIRDMEKVLRDIQEFQTKIREKLVPMIENMGKDLINTATNLKSQSSVSLDVTSWQVQATLKDTSREIQQFTRSYEVHDSVIRLVEKLEEVMTVLVKVYDRIQDFQEQQRLAAYLSHLASASVKQVVISDPKLSNSFRELQISIQSNIILNQYNSALNAFKQWIFPFAQDFLKDLKLPANLATSTNLDILASNAISRIQTIKSKVQIYKTTITKFDKNIYHAQFNSNSATMMPFYVWKNDEHREMIKKLLAGETVFAKADVETIASGKEAIKFNFVELGFKSDDPIVQTAIDKNLLNYSVNMTHLGNSNYRYNGQFFSITSPSQSISCSFEKSTNGKVIYGNNVYYKLLSGDIMLSPYVGTETNFG